MVIGENFFAEINVLLLGIQARNFSEQNLNVALFSNELSQGCRNITRGDEACCYLIEKWLE